MILEKEAQRKSVVNMLGRHLNPMEFARKTFSRRYREVYNKIKEIDTDMREAALSSDPGIREALHEARMSYKNREYPRVVFYAWKILESVDGIFYQIDELEKLRETMMEEFYGEGTKLSDKELRQMNEALGKKPEAPKVPKAAKLEYLLYAAAAPDSDMIPSEMVKQAGPIQWLKENIPTYHQMEGALLDRIFRNKMGKQREAAKRALNIAEKVYSSIKEVFKQLDAARTDFSSYIAIARRFKEKFNQQKQELSALYQAQFADIVPDMGKYNKNEGTAAPPAATPEAPLAATPEVAAPVVTPEIPVAQVPVQVPDIPSSKAVPAAAPSPSPSSSEAEWEYIEENGPPTLTSAQMEQFRANMEKPAAQVIILWKQAKIEAARGNRGISAALLVKASEICDDNDDAEDAKILIQAAERVLQG